MEIITVISLVAILATIGGQPVNSFMVGSKLAAEGKKLTSDIRMCRYEAIRTQQVHRLDLSALTTVGTYSCHVFLPVVEDDPATMNMNNPANWASILDNEYRELDPDIGVSISGPTIVYFQPDGTVTTHWTPGTAGMPAVPTTINLVLDPATLTVTITSGGILTSELFYEEY